MEAKEEILRIRGFKANLPFDFMHLVSVTKKKNARAFLCLPVEEYIKQDKLNTFFIGPDKIYFSGNYSKKILVRWAQIIKEWVAPRKVVIKYIPLI